MHTARDLLVQGKCGYTARMSPQKREFSEMEPTRYSKAASAYWRNTSDGWKILFHQGTIVLDT